MIRILALWILVSVIINAQTDWERWGPHTVPYEIRKIESIENLSKENSSGIGLLDMTKSLYKYLISDHDGDNCPFYPSCSAFLIQSVKETNIFQGLLMFADRFTRDSNFFKYKGQYPLHSSGKFYDPVCNYELDRKKLKLIH